MATVVSITNPITGAVEQVDKLGHTAQQIDDAVALAPQLSNPNLLDNWYFARPVNQRGQTEYTAEGYTIDRWKSGNSALKAELTSAGLAVSSAGASNAYLSQYFDGGIPIEDSYTISALVEAVTGTAYFQAAYSDGTFGSSIKLKQGLNTLAIKTDKTITRVLIQVNSGSSVTVKSAKLELGSQQTLAHLGENGNWVLNEIPNYADMLARCQAYAERLNIQMQAGFNQSFQYKVTKRATPTVTFISANGVTGKVSYYTGSAWEDVDAASVFPYPAAGNESLVLSDSPVVDGRVYSFTAFIFADL